MLSPVMALCEAFGTVRNVESTHGTRSSVMKLSIRMDESAGASQYQLF